MWFYDVQKRAGDARARPDSVEMLMNVVQLDPSKPQVGGDRYFLTQ
jgi:hypothetical protein